jgi:diguanylate cyclase (GGDEF)-like protein/putative nucleotidyltransferase with HDIG domain/PAS domain S-box-containing protein
MVRISAPTRISLTLACLCLSLLFAAQTLGLIPDQAQAILEARKTFCKALAAQACWAAQKEDVKRLREETLRLTEKNEGVLSVAILRANGQRLLQVGNHPLQMKPGGSPGSSADQVEIPIHKGTAPWGKVQICFRPLAGKGGLWWFTAPVRLILCLTLATFLLSRLYLKRILHHLDPSSVVPDRVHSTLDALAEGVLVIDTKQQIVLANKAFVEKSGRPRDKLQGSKVSDLKWTRTDKDAPFPWELAIRENAPQIGALLTMHSTPHHRCTFVVNATPVLGSDGKPRGAMATFDDVTSIEEKNLQLEEMLQSLKTSFEDVRQKNMELKVLAARDPLTGCLNRRSLFDAFVIEWQTAAAQGTFLSCVMVDVDHFKSVNDQHGHAAGDDVLRELSATLLEGVRKTDFVGRYGGEEFCLLLPRTSLQAAAAIAEKLRQRVAEACISRKVTASFGVSSTEGGAHHPQELLEEADRAMYLSKKLGRNRVTCWSETATTSQAEPRKEGMAGSSATSSLHAGIPMQSVNALMAALIFRDPMTAEHSRRVADLCVLTARGQMSEEQVYILEVAGLLHDMGKLGMPDSILLKPGALTQEERRIMSTHDRIGVEILRDAFSSKELSDIVGNSHAWYTGNPHEPDLPTGEDIPLGARILTVADAYDAMTSDRVYRKARPPAAAFDELRRCAGEQFDPKVVERFINVVSKDPLHATHRAASRQMALAMGIQAERIAIALEARDFGSLASMAGQVVATTRDECWAPVTTIAAKLQEAAKNDPDMFTLVSLTTELMQICNTSQESCLGDVQHAAVPALSLVDASAPTPAERNPT